MSDSTLQANHREKSIAGRLDRAAGGVNAVLLVLAIGLAMVDFTCFCAFEVREALPSMARANAGPPALSEVAKPEAPLANAARPHFAPSATGPTAGNW